MNASVRAIAPSFGHFLRLMDVVLPDQGAVMAICEGYFDESGSFDEEPKVFCVSGYFVEAESARVMAQNWSLILEEYGVPYFHMVDCAHGSGVYSAISKPQRIELVKRFIDLIKKHTLSGFSAIAHPDHFSISDDGPDIYGFCVDMCITSLYAFLKNQHIDGDVAYFFESGHNSRGSAYKHVAKKIADMSSSLTFADKAKVPLLQAADLLAWQSSKYVKDRMSRARPIRADFASLMEHPHSLAYVSGTNGDLAIAFEDWPLSRRSQKSVELSLHTEGPITHFCENGDPTPIVLIDTPIGWKEGGGKLIQIYFNTVGDKKLAIAFDRPRLELAIKALTMALDGTKPE